MILSVDLSHVDTQLHLPIPTTTVIASHKSDPYLVAVFRSTGKHGNKLVLPGGRVKVGKQNWLQTGLAELQEELGVQHLENIKLFCTCSATERDLRSITFTKFLDGVEVPETLPKDIKIIGHYTFDVVFTGQTDDDLRPDADEALEAFYIDVRSINPEDMALDQGRLLLAYRTFLESGVLPAPNQF